MVRQSCHSGRWTGVQYMLTWLTCWLRDSGPERSLGYQRPGRTVQCRRNRYFPLRSIFVSLREGSHALFCPEPIRMTWIRCAGWRGVKTTSCQETHSQLAATEEMLCLYYMYYIVNTNKSLIWIKDLPEMTEAVFGERKTHHTSWFLLLLFWRFQLGLFVWWGAIKTLIRSWGKFGIILANWLK